MEKNNRNFLVILIVAAIAVAVFASFGLPLFYKPTATITLPTPVPTGEDPSGEEQTVGVRVEIRPDTVQSVIAAMDRLESYSRTVVTTLNDATTTAEVWVDAGWTGSILTPARGPAVHTLVGDGKVWRWYAGDQKAVSWSAEKGSMDIEGQRIPTYEDVLALDQDSITAAGYQEKNGLSCVYVEVSVPKLGQTERYWVASDSGLLAAAETVVGEKTVWTMTSTVPEVPVSASAQFVLPDGTVLHQSSQWLESVKEEGADQG